MSKKMLEKLIFGISLIVTLFICCTLLRASWYSVMNADDFDYGVFMINENTHNIMEKIVGAWHLTVRQCMGWQGTYFTHFITGVFSPVTFRDVYTANRVIVTLFTLFFLVNLIWFLYTILRIEFGIKSPLIISTVVTMFFYVFTAYESYEEVLGWYMGAVSYTVPLSLGLCALVFMVKLFLNKKKCALWISAILGICASGGNLSIPAFTCSVGLILIIGNSIKSKKVNYQAVIILILWILAALVNVMMPGNFVRSSNANPDGLNIVSAIKNSFWMVLDRYIIIFGDNYEQCTNIVSILLICFVIGYLVRVSNKRKLRVDLLCVFLIAIVPFIIAFPNALGNGRYVMPNRTEFCIDFPIYIAVILGGVLVGNYLRGMVDEILVNKDKNRLVLFIFIISVLLSNISDGYSLRNNTLYEIHSQLESGVYKEYYDSCVGLFEILEKSEGDVTVTVSDYPVGIAHEKNFYLEDFDFWPNGSIAEYYGLNSIVLKLD